MNDIMKCGSHGEGRGFRLGGGETTTDRTHAPLGWSLDPEGVGGGDWEHWARGTYTGQVQVE